MKIADIKSETIHDILAGSATPAGDIQGLWDERKISQAEFNEACDYFKPLGGLKAAADVEDAFCRKWDV